MKFQPEKLMKKFEYEDQRVSRLLGMFDDHVHFIQNYDDEFEMGGKEHEALMLAGYRNNAFGILLSLFLLGYMTTGDFHNRMHALNTVYFNRVGY